VAEVRLRPVTEEDLPILFEHQRDPDAIQMAALKPREWDAFAERWAKILVDESVTACAIDLDDAVAGHIVSFDRDGVREVGYWIGRAFWGQGIATAALNEFVRMNEFRPLHATVARNNPASIRVLEKCGFMITGYRTAPADDRWDEEIEEVLLKLEAR
jgi:RimJ/RimL family protein N-acetyltransferase